MLSLILQLLARHAVTGLGAVGVSGDGLEAQVLGALGLGVSVGWSVVEKVRARRAANRAQKE